MKDSIFCIHRCPAPKKYVAISRSPNSEDRSAFYQSLKEYGRFTGLCWLMSPEPSPQAKLPVPTIEEIIYSDEFIQTKGAQQQLDCLVRKAKITITFISISEMATADSGVLSWLSVFSPTANRSMLTL